MRESLYAEEERITDMLLTDVVPDEKEQIENKLVHYADVENINLVMTTGGTGFRFVNRLSHILKIHITLLLLMSDCSVRDITPEATKAILHREAPGLVIAMINGLILCECGSAQPVSQTQYSYYNKTVTAESLRVTPFGWLSRAAAGTRYKTLIVNLPGSPKAVKEVTCYVCLRNSAV